MVLAVKLPWVFISILTYIKLKKTFNYRFLLLLNKTVSINLFFYSSYFDNVHVFFRGSLLLKNDYFFSVIKCFKVVLKFISSIKKKLLLLFCNFLYSKIFLKVGLGFRKKYSKNMNVYILSIGRRY